MKDNFTGGSNTFVSLLYDTWLDVICFFLHLLLPCMYIAVATFIDSFVIGVLRCLFQR